jgi:hypothetical protein
MSPTVSGPALDWNLGENWLRELPAPSDDRALFVSGLRIVAQALRATYC